MGCVMGCQLLLILLAQLLLLLLERRTALVQQPFVLLLQQAPRECCAALCLAGDGDGMLLRLQHPAHRHGRHAEEPPPV